MLLGKAIGKKPHGTDPNKFFYLTPTPCVKKILLGIYNSIQILSFTPKVNWLSTSGFARLEGFEPPTDRLERDCSIH